MGTFEKSGKAWKTQGNFENYSTKRRSGKFKTSAELVDIITLCGSSFSHYYDSIDILFIKKKLLKQIVLINSCCHSF